MVWCAVRLSSGRSFFVLSSCGPFSIRRGTHIMQQIVWAMFLRQQVPLGMKVWWGLLLLKKKTCYTLVRKCRWSHTSPRPNTTTDHHHDHSTAQNGTPQHHNHTPPPPPHTTTTISASDKNTSSPHAHPHPPSADPFTWRSGLAERPCLQVLDISRAPHHSRSLLASPLFPCVTDVAEAESHVRST